jgi:D-beta-D-heptose 7-phosphate kinase/D-beta-D-heptose 1-phosphate adenosyltransferase
MKRVLVIGDYIVDRYHMHTAARLCPEAPVPVLHKTKPAYDKPGGAGLVYEQLKAFGSLEVHAIFTSQSRKERFFADDHLLLRVDEDSELVVREGPVLAELGEALPWADAVVVSDYGKQGFTPAIVQRLAGCSFIKCPVFVDAKTNWNQYRYFFAAFPNATEVKSASWKEAAFQHSIVKCGAAGCSVDGKDVPTLNVPVRDVTGAGDVFLAAFVRHYLEQKGLIQAARYANRIAGLSVQHVGTYVVPKWDAEIHISELNLAA